MSFIAKSQTLQLQRKILTYAAANRFFTSPAHGPTTAHYDELANAAGRSGDFDELRSLLSRRTKEGFYNTARTFDFVSTTYTEPIETLCEALSAIDKGHARKSAFDALISRLCRVGRVDEALRAADAMARAGCAPTAATFNPVVGALARGGRVGAAWRVVDRMRELGAWPDAPTFNAILLEHCAAANAEAAAAAVERMAERGTKADARTFDALVLCACKVGRVEGALRLLRRMKDEGVGTFLSTRMYVVDALLGMGCYDMAVRFVRVYARKDMWLDRESFRCLANRFVRMKRLDMARLVLEEMKTRGFEIGGDLKGLIENES